MSSSDERNGTVATAEQQDRADSLQREVDRRVEIERDLHGQLASQTAGRTASDELFRLLVASVKDYAIFMLDPGGHIATWNAGAERFKGYQAHEIIGRHFSVFYPETDVRAGKCEYELDVATRVGRFEEEGWRVRKDGTQFWANVSITAVRDPAGQLVGFAKVTRDLTERRLAEEQRRAEEQRFRLLIESVQDYAIFILDPRGNVSTWNAGAARFKGYTAAEIVGRHFSVFYPEEEVRAGKCEHELEVAAREGRFEDEGWRIRKDGSRFWANVIITALRDPAGKLVGFGKVTRDLTERRIAESDRRAAEERFHLLIESIQDYAIFMLDPRGNVASWNPGAERIKGYRADEIIGSHFSRFYPEDDLRAGKCEMELEVAARDGRFEDEGWRIRKDGGRFWANVVITAVRAPAGKLIGFAKITRDLTDRKRAEEETAARLAAEKTNRTKDEFLATLGHELRNPLAPISSALQLLKLRGDIKSVREHQIIERQVNHMTRLVDDLLDVSRISRGNIALKRESIDLRDALSKATEMAIPLFEQKQQHFQITAPPRQLMVDGDESRLVQVFANLLGNASRYTPPSGRILVNVRDVGKEIIIDVRDDGIGIEPDLLPRIFDLFVQGHQTAERAKGGLGLGLTLVRSIVGLHDGHVEARSKGLGRGSTFTVRLPAVHEAPAANDTGHVSTELSAKPAKRRVLVVDDNDDARMLLVDVLCSLGHDVESAGDGKTALNILDKFTPDVAILDIGLPGMDGYELAQRIREAPRGASIRLVALSGYVQDSDKQRGVRAGFDAHLTKPVGLARLLEEIVAGAEAPRT